MKIKQGGWVMLAALLLVVASLAGLNAYVLAEGAQTGVQTVSQAEVPKEGSTVDIVWETYDNYYVDMPQYLDNAYIGYGLTKREKERLAALKEAFSAGTRPEGKPPSLPEETGFAVTPLDPAAFAGMEEYYFLPKRELTDEELLQLIAYGEEKGTSFTADVLTIKNCVRGSRMGINRLTSAGEDARAKILFKRFYQEGLLAASKGAAPVTLPISGITNIPLNRDMGGDPDSFIFIPIRALSDEEILELFSWGTAGDYLVAAQEGFDIKKDKSKARSLLEDVLGMPLAVEEDQMYYTPGETTGSVLFRALFTRPKINGRATSYSITLDITTGQCMAMDESTEDDSWYYLDDDGSLHYGPIVTDPEISDPVDERLVASARAAVEKLTTVKQSRVAPVPGLPIGDPFESDAHLAVFMMDGSTYLTAVRNSDFKTYALEYHPDR